MSQYSATTARERNAERVAQPRGSHAHGPLGEFHTKRYVAELVGTFLLVFLVSRKAISPRNLG